MAHKKKEHLAWWTKDSLCGLHGLKWNKQKGPKLKFQNGKWVKIGK